MSAATVSPIRGQSALDFADQQPRDHLSILLYGASGEGKSVGACSAPGPIIVANADGPGALRFARRHHRGKDIRELKVSGRKELDTLYLELRDGVHSDVETFVLDSFGRIYDLVLADLAGIDEHNRPRKPTLPQRGDVNTYLERYVLALLELPIHVVIVAHDNPVVVSGNQEDGTAEIELFPFTGTNNPALAKKLMRPLDVVGYCGRMTVGEGDEQAEQFVAQVFKAGGRHAKDRTGVLGQFPELDLSAWVEKVAAAYAVPSSPAADKEKKS